MKKIVIFLSFLFICCAFTTEAQVWRLNNQGGVSANFTTTLQNAIDSISPGDTLYVEQSPFSYGPATITKKVILIGGGFWLEENDSTQANKEKSMIGQLILNPGSQGSVISGFYLYKEFPSRTSYTLIGINTDSITFQKNYLLGFMPGCQYSSCVAYGIAINGTRNAILIQQNWIESRADAQNICVYVNGIAEDVVIRNNFLKAQFGQPQSIREGLSNTTIGLFIQNNVLWGDIYTYSASIVNNIQVSGIFYDGGSGIASNNLCSGVQFPASNNNQQNVNMANVFVDYDKYIDNGYLLAPGSPAKNAGFNGGDCGAFSNDFGGIPYVLSGMPNIPAIFDIHFNSTFFPSTFDSLEINVKAKSHN